MILGQIPAEIKVVTNDDCDLNASLTRLKIARLERLLGLTARGVVPVMEVWHGRLPLSGVRGKKIGGAEAPPWCGTRLLGRGRRNRELAALRRGTPAQISLRQCPVA